MIPINDRDYSIDQYNTFFRFCKAKCTVYHIGILRFLSILSKKRIKETPGTEIREFLMPGSSQ